MKTITALTDENAARLAWAVKLTGLSLEEIVNLLLADELTYFRPGDEDDHVLNTLGCWRLKDRASAERTLTWVKKRISQSSKAPPDRSPAAASRLTLFGPGATAKANGFPGLNGESDGPRS